MLKKIIPSLLLSIFSIISYGQETTSYILPKTKNGTKFSLSGKVDGRDTGRLILAYTNLTGKYIIDTTYLNKGYFKFSGAIAQPTVAHIIGILKTNLIEDPNRTVLFLEPNNMKILLTEDDFPHANLSGSKTQIAYDKLNLKRDPLETNIYSNRKEISKISDSIKRVGESASLNSKLIDLRNKLAQNYSTLRRINLDYITSNPSSFISPYLMEYQLSRLSVDSTILIFENFSSEVKQSPLGVNIARMIKSKDIALIGDSAADFTAKDINGEVISLKDFNGKKYVLLEFWFAACGSCRLQIPYLKKLYQAYNNKGIEIISIAIDKRKVWKDAIAEDGTGIWRHILKTDIYKSRDNWPMELNYNIKGYPTLILINKEGKIVYREIGFDESIGLKKLEEKLVEL